MKTENKTLQFPEGLFKNYFGDDRIADLLTKERNSQRESDPKELSKKHTIGDCVPGKSCS